MSSILEILIVQFLLSPVAQLSAIEAISVSVHPPRSPFITPSNLHHKLYSFPGRIKPKKVLLSLHITSHHIALPAITAHRARTKTALPSYLRPLLAQRRVPRTNQPSARFQSSKIIVLTRLLPISLTPPPFISISARHINRFLHRSLRSRASDKTSLVPQTPRSTDLYSMPNAPF